MAKNYQSIPNIMKIKIDVYDVEKEIWHFSIDTKSDSKIESVCSRDWFKRLVDDVYALMLAVTILDDSIKPIREALQANDVDKIKKIIQNMVNSKMLFGQNIGKNKNRGQVQRMGDLANYLDSSVETIKKQISKNDPLQKIAIALALTRTTFEEVENQINSNDKFEKEIPINEIPDLPETFAKKASQYWDIVNTFNNIINTGLSFGRQFINLP